MLITSSWVAREQITRLPQKLGTLDLSFKVQLMANLTGNYSLSVPVLGHLNGSFELKEQSEISLSGKLASLIPSPTLWDQTYVDLQMS